MRPLRVGHEWYYALRSWAYNPNRTQLLHDKLQTLDSPSIIYVEFIRWNSNERRSRSTHERLDPTLQWSENYSCRKLLESIIHNSLRAIPRISSYQFGPIFPATITFQTADYKRWKTRPTSPGQEIWREKGALYSAHSRWEKFHVAPYSVYHNGYVCSTSPDFYFFLTLTYNKKRDGCITMKRALRHKHEDLHR